MSVPSSAWYIGDDVASSEIISWRVPRHSDIDGCSAVVTHKGSQISGLSWNCKQQNKSMPAKGDESDLPSMITGPARGLGTCLDRATSEML